MVAYFPVGVKFLVEGYKFFEERITLGVQAGGVFKRKRSEPQMQFVHTLKERKVLNVFCLDFIREQFVVGAFAFLWLRAEYAMPRFASPLSPSAAPVRGAVLEVGS